MLIKIETLEEFGSYRRIIVDDWEKAYHILCINKNEKANSHESWGRKAIGLRPVKAMIARLPKRI